MTDKKKNDKVKKLSIDGYSFLMRRLSAQESMNLQFKLVRTLGGLLNVELPKGVSLNGMKQEDVALLLPLIGQGASNINADELSELVIEICESQKVLIDGDFEEITFNEVFEDSLMTSYYLVFEFIQFEYKVFTKGLLSKFKKDSPRKENQTGKNTPQT